jgi:glutamate 5-kinase
MVEEIVVVKFGSELITDENGLNTEAIQGYVDGLCKRHGSASLIVITSGAVATGRHILSQKDKDNATFSDQQRAQLGGSVVFAAWQSAFERAGHLAGGLLVTHHDLTLSAESKSLRNLLRKNIRNGIISVVNANDALNLAELLQLPAGADNDALASHIAQFMKATRLRLFTLHGGIVDDTGNLVELVTGQNIKSVTKMVSERNPGNGRGGIQSKLASAWEYVQDTNGIAEISKPDKLMGGNRQTILRTTA